MGLEESLSLLTDSLKRYQALNYLARKDQNYKKPGVGKLFTTRCKEIDLYLAIGECKRLMATQLENDYDRIKKLKEAGNDCHVAYDCVRALKPSSEDEIRQAKIAEGNILTKFGEIYAQAKLYFASKDCYKRASKLYEENNYGEGEASIMVKMTKLEIEHNRIGVLLEKMKKLKASGNREEEQLRSVFDKHDTDNSGDISTEEFKGIATDLGTVPELSDEELKEAVSQIDKSNDGEFSFEELWTWWIQDKL
jgi:Ca2+-binding EF-hand superfamily protein